MTSLASILLVAGLAVGCDDATKTDFKAEPGVESPEKPVEKTEEAGTSLCDVAYASTERMFAALPPAGASARSRKYTPVLPTPPSV